MKNRTSLRGLRFLPAVLLLCALGEAGGREQETGASALAKGRAMWVWNTANTVNNIINDVGEYRAVLYDFCRSPHGNPDHRITTLFMDCKQAVQSNRDNLRDFIADAQKNGIEIEYLDGDPSWATYNSHVGLARLQLALDFNAGAAAENEKLAGVQFDVEPYLLKAGRGYLPPYWDTQKDSVWDLYVTAMDSCQKFIDRSDSTLRFGIAIPRWYESHVGNARLYSLQSLVDYVAIMDYNESSSVIIRDAENEIKNALMLNKRVWIGVETKDVTPEPETVSFHEEGVMYMEEELTKVMAAYGDYPVFSGIAIHAYHYYASLPLTTEVEKTERSISRTMLFNAAGNPVRGRTTIQFQVDAAMPVEIVLFNLLGQKVATLIDEMKQPGLHQVTWHTANNPPGLYFYRMRTPQEILTKKMVVVR
jgi:hypothetical protein